MQITRLRLSGFKSFLQPTELMIEPGLTGVVGPNGCGKSNLVEALRWVMGETSARGLRGGEMDDVIFAGTAARPAFDLAEVTLWVRGAKLSLPGLEDAEELELSRRIARGTGSAYRANGRELRARDVQLLFADAASGARSAAIIGQGQIGALVEAKPTERRRLIEDAAGIGGLQARRHEAELKLQAAEANLLRLEDLLATLEQQHRSLRRQARDAVRYRELSAAVREAEAALLIGRWRLAFAELTRAQAAFERSRERIAGLAEALARARAGHDEATRRVSAMRGRDAGLATELARLGERRNALVDEARRLDADRDRQRQLEQQLQQDLVHAERTLKDAHASRERLDAEQRSLREATGPNALYLERAASMEAAAEEEVRAADQVLRETLAACAGLEARQRQASDLRAGAGEERHALEAAISAADARLAGLAVRGEGPDGDILAAAEVELAAALQARDLAEAELRGAEERRESARAALLQAEQKLRERRAALEIEEERARRERDRRGTLAERRGDLEQRRERLKARRAELVGRVHELDDRTAALDLGGLENAQAEAEGRLAEAETVLEHARRAAEAAAAGVSRAEQAEREHQACLAPLEAEARVLAELTSPNGHGPAILELVDVAEDRAGALGAALGDDLMASLDPSEPLYWREDVGAAAASGSPSLPAGVRALADLVTAPPALARRLAQVGMVEAARAAELQPHLAQGQRLVSPDGGLWRWDGLVRQPDAEGNAAARLRQQSRLRQLDAELAEGKRELQLSRKEAERARGARTETMAELERCESAREAARTALAETRERVTEARAAAGALAAELTSLQDGRAVVDAEIAELTEAIGSLAVQLEGAAEPFPDPALLRRHLTDAEDEHAAAVDQHESAEDDQAEARPAVNAARERLDAARAEADRLRAAAESAKADTARSELERAQIEAEVARARTDLGALERRVAASAFCMGDIEVELAGARRRLSEAEEMLASERQRHADARTEHARLQDRQLASAGRLRAIDQEIELWTERATAAEARISELSERRAAFAGRLEELAEAVERAREQQGRLEGEIAGAEDRRAALGPELSAAEAALVEARTALERAETERVDARESGARLEARLEQGRVEAQAAEAAVVARLEQLPALEAEDAPSAEVLAGLENDLARSRIARERLGPVNLRAIDEAKELADRVEVLQTEKAELEGAIERLRRAIGTLNREGRERLRAAFAEVERHFEALFARLFGGGRAHLALTDLDDPLAAGLEVTASPPGKKLQSVHLLSGGEKALTALALIFAVFLTRPAPLCVLDEVDAPLDDANVDRLGTLLDDLAAGTDTRFLVVTHHPLTMARMDRLYGVTMVERGISQLVSVDLRRAEALRATA